MRTLHVFAYCCFAGPVLAQTVEVEPNDSKATATVVAAFSAGQTLGGSSNSGSTTGLDYFDITMAPAAPGIYRHQLAITSTTPGFTGTLRGLNQTGGLVGTCPALGTSPVIGTSDNTAQTSSSSTQSVPPYMNAWYGFGAGERLYYRVTGTSTTTSTYTATLTSTAVTPAVIPGSFNAGTLTIQTVGQTTVDTDIILLNSNYQPVVTSEGAASNDDEHCTSAGATSNALQSRLTRALAPGTYYLGISGYDLKNNTVAPTDDDFMLGTLMDFPGIVCTSSTSLNADRDFQISDGTNTYTSTGAVSSVYFEVQWYQFTVGGGYLTICEPGVGGVLACPCANPPIGGGKGCDNSAATGGATIAATGSANTAADTLVFTSSAQTANGTTILLQGNSLVAGGLGAPFGQGVRCVGGTLKRLYVKSPGGAGGISAPTGADASVSARSAALGDPIPAGSTRYYMAYYRDPIVLGGCAASATFNATQGLQINWQ